MLDSVAGIQALEAQIDGIRSAAAKHIDQRLAHVRRASDHARRDMLLSVLTLIPLAALLAYICSVVVTRPLRDLFRTISELGHGRYSHPVSITFPLEMRPLGLPPDLLLPRPSPLLVSQFPYI